MSFCESNIYFDFVCVLTFASGCDLPATAFIMTSVDCRLVPLDAAAAALRHHILAPGISSLPLRARSTARPRSNCHRTRGHFNLYRIQKVPIFKYTHKPKQRLNESKFKSHVLISGKMTDYLTRRFDCTIYYYLPLFKNGKIVNCTFKNFFRNDLLRQTWKIKGIKLVRVKFCIRSRGVGDDRRVNKGGIE